MGPGCRAASAFSGGDSDAARLRLDRAAGEARPALGCVLTGWGAGSGRLHRGDPGKHSPRPRRRPHWGARRDEPETPLHRCCHRAINTVSAHTRRRLRRVPSAKSAAGGWAAGAQGQRLRAGDCRGSSCAAASASGGMASHRPRPPAPSSPACAAGRLQPTGCAPCGQACLPGPARVCRAGGCGRGRLRNAAGLRGWGGSLQPRVSAAVPSSRGESPTSKTRVECPQRAANFLMRPRATEHPFCFRLLVVGRCGGGELGEMDPVRSMRSLALTFQPVWSDTHVQIYSHIVISTHAFIYT